MADTTYSKPYTIQPTPSRSDIDDAALYEDRLDQTLPVDKRRPAPESVNSPSEPYTLRNT